MNRQTYEEDILAKIPQRIWRPLQGGLALLVVLGLAAFAFGAAGDDGLRTWQIFLVNFLVWTGVAQSGVVFAAIMQVANGRWGRSVKRIAEGTAAFLPISFVLYHVLFFGRRLLFPWIQHPIAEKAAWLNFPFLFARDGISLLFLFGLSFAFLYYSLRPDLGLALERGLKGSDKLYRMMTANWGGLEAERRRSQRMLCIISPIILISYAYVFSLLAFDLVMSLSPHWYSNIFGVYFFMGNLYLGLATILILAVLVRKYMGLDAYITGAQFHDLGKLLFGFSIFWAYLSFTQYLVIWYGNMPEETEFLLRRLHQQPWAALSWSVAVVCFVIPFIILLSRVVKRQTGAMLMLSILVVMGMWFERYLLVVPSLWEQQHIPLGLIEILISLGFLAAVALTYLWFVRTFPSISLADPAVAEASHEAAQTTA